MLFFEGICQLFENKLKVGFLALFVTGTPLLLKFVACMCSARSDLLLQQTNPNARHLTYDIADLYAYIDGLTDLSALVYAYA